MPLDVGYSKGRPLPRAQATQQLPKLEARRRRNVFRILAHPKKWCFDADAADGLGAWFPQVDCIPLRPGVNGVTAREDGTLSTASFDAGMRELGFVDLTFHDVLSERHGEDGQLVFEHPQANGGKHYGPPWEELGVVYGQTKKRVNQKAFDAFKADAAEVLGGMVPEEFAARMEMWEARTGTYRIDRRGGAGNERIIAWRDERAAQMRAAYERQYPKPEPEKKPRRARVERAEEVSGE